MALTAAEAVARRDGRRTPAEAARLLTMALAEGGFPHLWGVVEDCTVCGRPTAKVRGPVPRSVPEKEAGGRAYRCVFPLLVAEVLPTRLPHVARADGWCYCAERYVYEDP